MLSKVLYGKIELEKEKLKQNNIFHNINIEYYKTQNSENNKKYGIEIIKKENVNNKWIEEKKNVDFLTKEENIINSVLELLKRNEVTPIGLNDVINDLFDK